MPVFISIKLLLLYSIGINPNFIFYSFIIKFLISLVKSIPFIFIFLIIPLQILVQLFFYKQFPHFL